MPQAVPVSLVLVGVGKVGGPVGLFFIGFRVVRNSCKMTPFLS